MRTLTKSETFFNSVKLTADDQLFVGVDVHKKSYHVAFYLNDAPAIDFVMPAKKDQLNEKLKLTAPALRQVAYETGPTGYGLARYLKQQSLPVMVAATSRIPKLNNPDKTDKLDSKDLAAYAAKDLLTGVAIPTVKQEAERQLFRMRHRQARNLAKIKVQIKSFLLMHDLEEPAGLTSWKRDAVVQLRTLPMHKTLRLSLDELLADLDYYTARVKALEKLLAEHLQKEGKLAQRIALLKTHPGVGVVVACQFAVELFHYRQFDSSRQLFKYLGLSPTVRQSGQRSVRGNISSVSNSRLRTNLIQAAWRWIAVDVKARQDYYRLLNNCGQIKQKAIVGMARKLSGHLWVMLVRNQPYDPKK